MLICSFDGLKGFEEAIKASFPKAEIQECVVHQIRNSTKFVSYKDRKVFCADMREIYTANEEAGLAALDRFENKWALNIHMQSRVGETIGNIYQHSSNILLK